MFLRQLTLKGFKSFADTTALTLEPGVTVVVGPNGSGKSNVVDAIAWVLGAQAPSSVRSQKMDDVIFAGTARRPALGRAEVSLTIDNSAGLLPIEFTEVTVTRTLWRSGDSEYAINGVPCRLLDVQELLSDSGVGRQQHVIVSQGQIDAVLNARPEDRRAIVEEAAGVLKYRKRKERAERRLEATEGNLLRVQDLLREVRRQLRPLERQADAARRHGDVMAELTALRLYLAGRDIHGLRRRLENLAAERRELAEREQRIRHDLAGLDTGVLAAEARLATSGARDIGDSLVRVGQLRERARGLYAVLHERRRSLERDRVQLMDSSVAASLEAEAARLRTELTQVAEARATLEPDMVALLEDEETFAAQDPDVGGDDLQSIYGAGGAGGAGSHEPGDTDGRARDLAGATASAARAAAEVRGELRTRRAAHQRDAAELSELDRRLAVLTARAADLSDRATELQAGLSAGEAAEVPMVAELEAVHADVLAAEAAHERATREHHDAVAEERAWSARVEALGLALDTARARAGAEHLAEVDGVLGTLLDLVRIDDGWEAAFEAAAGEALTAVVVADAGAARRALTRLHEADVRGGVLAAGAPVPVPRTLPAGEPVRRHVHSAVAGVDALLDALLANAVAVPGGWAEALDAALSVPGAVVVTRAGDRFSTEGWRVGLGGTGATASALEEARERLSASALDAAARRVALEDATAALAAFRTAEGAVARRLDAHDGETTSATERLAAVRAEARDAGRALDDATTARAAIEERHAVDSARIVELSEALAALEADEASEQDAARRREDLRARREAEARALALRRRDLAVRGASIEERSSVLEHRLADVDRRLTEGMRAQADAAARVATIERSAVAVDRLLLLVEARRGVVEGRLAELQEERHRQTEEMRHVTAELEGLRRRRGDAEKALSEVDEHQRRCEIGDAEARMRLEGAVEGLRRDLDVEPETAMAAEAPEVPDGVTPAARVRDLEREIRLMGPINPLALEEFTALQERHGFLEGQLEDVRTTRRELQRVIRSVDAEIQSVFAAAYADVSGHFSALFAVLFPGGAGRLILTNPDDLLNTGIEVEAKPSGKNVKKLSLLSGGERSLTALAFLFAVFRSRPSPFYVMDEVEAALDDVNLHRFLGLLAEFRADAQLLVVSHQKRTMEAADCLVGVTMQPGGSSKVVTERVTADL